MLINTAGGLTGGDDGVVAGRRAPGARMVLTTQACERVYRSLGDDATVRTRIEVGAGAHLDWLPQETILFEGAPPRPQPRDRPRPSTRASSPLKPSCSAAKPWAKPLAVRASTDNWRIRRNGRLIHAEATRLTGTTDAERDNLALLANANAFATLLYVARRCRT